MAAGRFGHAAMTYANAVVRLLKGSLSSIFGEVPVMGPQVRAIPDFGPCAPAGGWR